MRHGEVHNPEGILYGRIEGFGLSELGRRMASAAAQSLATHPVTALYASPLQRAQESAAPWAEQFGLPVITEERLIEPWNDFEGGRMNLAAIVRSPSRVRNPFRPSWGEPYTQVRDRMLAAMTDAWAVADGGEVVMVSHQMPIVTVTRALGGRKLHHDPRKRRCTLSSITTFERSGDSFAEIGYQEPAAGLLAESVDSGAV